MFLTYWPIGFDVLILVHRQPTPSHYWDQFSKREIKMLARKHFSAFIRYSRYGVQLLNKKCASIFIARRWHPKSEKIFPVGRKAKAKNRYFIGDNFINSSLHCRGIILGMINKRKHYYEETTKLGLQKYGRNWSDKRRSTVRFFDQLICNPFVGLHVVYGRRKVSDDIGHFGSNRFWNWQFQNWSI